MPEPKVYEFSKRIGELCVTRGTDVYKLGAKLNIGSEAGRLRGAGLAPSLDLLATGHSAIKLTRATRDRFATLPVGNCHCN